MSSVIIGINLSSVANSCVPEQHVIGIYLSSVANSCVFEQHAIGIYLSSVANSCVPEQRDNRYLPEQCGEQLCI
jgi:hypothetical protein